MHDLHNRRARELSCPTRLKDQSPADTLKTDARNHQTVFGFPTHADTASYSRQPTAPLREQTLHQ